VGECEVCPTGRGLRLAALVEGLQAARALTARSDESAAWLARTADERAHGGPVRVALTAVGAEVGR
jgi:hypothetical protein